MAPPPSAPPGLVRLVAACQRRGSRYLYGGTSLVRGIDCSAWVSALVWAMGGRGGRHTTGTLRAGAGFVPGWPTVADEAAAQSSIFDGRPTALVLWDKHVGLTWRDPAGLCICDSGGKGAAPDGGPRFVPIGWHGSMPVGRWPLSAADLRPDRLSALLALCEGGPSPLSWLS